MYLTPQAYQDKDSYQLHPTRLHLEFHCLQYHLHSYSICFSPLKTTEITVANAISSHFVNRVDVSLCHEVV